MICGNIPAIVFPLFVVVILTNMVLLFMLGSLCAGVWGSIAASGF